MARISTLPAGTPESTAALVGVLNSTTVQFDVEDVLGVPITAQGDLLIGDSSNNSTRLAAGSSGQILGLTTGVPSWQADPSTGHITTVGTSGQFLQTTGGAASWEGMTAGTLLIGNSSGEVTELGAGSSKQVLGLTTGVPSWNTDLSTGHITTAGTSGQLLQTTGGAAAWVAMSDIDGTPDPSTGHITTAGTSGQILQTTGGAADWVGMTANTILVGNSSGEIVELAAGTSGQKFVSRPAPGWIDDDWGVSFIIDGGGSTITASTKGTIRVPWDVGLEGWELHGDTTGDITVDLYVEDFSSTPASSNSKITSTEVPILTNAQRNSGACSSWTTKIVAGDYITVDVTGGSSDITLVTLSLFGKKLSTV